jgi:hypothetical protein
VVPATDAETTSSRDDETSGKALKNRAAKGGAPLTLFSTEGIDDERQG